MEKIKFMADTPCDITDEDLKRYNIDMPSVPITVDGQSFFERRSFSIKEFYKVLNEAEEIPATSRVPAADFMDCYQRAFNEGYTTVINVTINAGGSGTNASAIMAREMFFQEVPQAVNKIDIHIIDSKTYSMGYGYPVMEAAKMAEAGASSQDILAYLNEWFNAVEIYLGCYSLKHAKKSGRINAAAAFVGDMLGLRPIIRMVDGETTIVEKIRGDKNLVPRLFEIYKRERRSADDPVIVVHGEDDECGAELCALLEAELGHKIPMYNIGASIAINAGPNIVALVSMRK